MKTACQILLLLLMGGCIAIGGKTTVIEREQAQTYIIIFEPVPPFVPQTSRDLLDAFNENHPPGIRTHRYRTRIGENMLIGMICVDTEQGREKVVKMLEKSKQLKLVQVERADQERLQAHYKLGQPSLRQAQSSPKQSQRRSAPKLRSKGAEVRLEIAEAPEIIEKACSELGISAKKVDSEPGSLTYVGESIAGVYVKIDVIAVVREISYLRVSVDATSPVANALLSRVHSAIGHPLR